HIHSLGGADAENSAHRLGETSSPRLTEVRKRYAQLTLELENVPAGKPEKRDLDVMPARQRLQLGHGPRWRADYEAAWRLAEERCIQAKRRLRLECRATHSETREQAGLGERDQHASVGAIVGAAQEPCMGGGQDQPAHGPLPNQVQRGWPARHLSMHHLEVLGAAEVVVARADQKHEVALVTESCVKALGVVVDLADHADDWRGIDAGSA